MPRSLWAAGPLDRLARLLNIPTVVDECDVLLAVVSSYVSLREEGKVCSLALFGNFTYAESSILEDLSLQYPVSSDISETSRFLTWGHESGATPDGLPAL